MTDHYDRHRLTAVAAVTIFFTVFVVPMCHTVDFYVVTVVEDFLLAVLRIRVESSLDPREQLERIPYDYLSIGRNRSSVFRVKNFGVLRVFTNTDDRVVSGELSVHLSSMRVRV